MDGAELRRRLNQLDRSYTALAPLLGLSLSGLHKQMNGQASVSRQTELLLQMLERRAPPGDPVRTKKKPAAKALQRSARKSKADA